MVLSWLRVFGVRGALLSIDNVLRKITEPVLAPVRRMLPRTGMFDLSFLLVFVLVQVISGSLRMPRVVLTMKGRRFAHD